MNPCQDAEERDAAATERAEQQADVEAFADDVAAELDVDAGLIASSHLTEKEPEMTQTDTSADTRTVIVRDTAAETARWGHGPVGIITREITLRWVCPQCGGPRGEVRGHNFYVDGDYGHVNVWRNPCGHIDMYTDVIKEAAATASPARCSFPALS